MKITQWHLLVFCLIYTLAVGCSCGGATFPDAASIRNKPYADIREFGAASGSDITTAFRASVASATTIYIPNGNYILSDYVFFQNDYHIIGQSQRDTIITFSPTTATYAFLIDAYNTFENFTLIASTSTNAIAFCSYTPTTSNGFRDSTIRNVTISGFRTGIGSSEGLSRSLVFNNVFESVWFYNCGIPVYLGAGCNANVFRKCIFEGTWGATDSADIYINQGTTCHFDTCSFEPASTTLPTFMNGKFVAAPSMRFTNSYFEPSSGFYFDSSPGFSFDSFLSEAASASALTSNAFVRTVDSSSASMVIPGPYYGSIRGAVFRASEAGQYIVSDEGANANTRTNLLGYNTLANLRATSADKPYKELTADDPYLYFETAGSLASSVFDFSARKAVFTASLASGASYEIFNTGAVLGGLATIRIAIPGVLNHVNLYAINQSGGATPSVALLSIDNSAGNYVVVGSGTSGVYLQCASGTQEFNVKAVLHGMY